MNDTNFIKAGLILIIAVMIGLILWSVINAIMVSRRNKFKEEANSNIFAARMKQIEKENHKDNPAKPFDVEYPASTSDMKDHFTTHEELHKPLDYENYDNKEIEEQVGNLKDFFRN